MRLFVALPFVFCAGTILATALAERDLGDRAREERARDAYASAIVAETLPRSAERRRNDVAPAPRSPADDAVPRHVAASRPASTEAPGALARGPRARPRRELFVNTYYDFPVESAGTPDTPLYDAHCEPIALVDRSFHDHLCVQGSGRLASGDTVSFAARDCACAMVCPRTGQRICYERLDPRRYPNGRGATGRAITPLRSVAVDPSVIPLGTALYIPELAGLPRADGSRHDGCFMAEDTGHDIKGHRIDVFAGDLATRMLLETAAPSNRGLDVIIGDARCAARLAAPGSRSPIQESRRVR